jgi:hypothetical protein
MKAQKGGRGIALTIPEFGARRGMSVANTTSRYGRARKISPPPGFKTRIVQLDASLYRASTIASLLQQWQSNLGMWPYTKRFYKPLSTQTLVLFFYPTFRTVRARLRWSQNRQDTANQTCLGIHRQTCVATFNRHICPDFYLEQNFFLSIFLL